MAKAHSTASVKKSIELRVEEYDWGKYYRGTEAAFIASGLMKPEWFPGKPGNPKSSCCIGMLDGEMKILPYGAIAHRRRKELISIKLWKVGKQFAAYVHFSEEEKERKELKERIEKLHAEKKQKLESAPKTPGDFLKKKSRKIQDFMEDIHNLFRRAENGFHYAPEIVEEAQELMADLISLAANGRVCFDAVRQKYFLDDIERKAEKAHPEFSAFMKATLAVGKAAL